MGNLRVINVYNTYNLLPTTNNPSAIPKLERALEAAGEYIILRDFNLYYPN